MADGTGVPSAKVLVVDDEDGIRVLCRVNLELAGYEVIEAPDGPTALQMAMAEQPDVVFLDVMMPGMDGWEVLHRLKQDDRTAGVPVVMLTARTSEADQIRAWGEGVMDYLSKPFSPEVLEEQVERALAPQDPEQDHQRRRRVIEQLKSLQELRRRT